jgi:hypothetical protein
MVARRLLALTLLALCGAWASAADMVGVPGSDVKYPAAIQAKIAGKDARLVLTGTALRSKFVFNVYTLGSYLQEGVKARSAEELAAIDAPKQLHLVMERDVDGKDMADAFHSAIRLNHASPAFDKELTALMEYMKMHPVKKGDNIWLMYVPGAGLQCNIIGKGEVKINNPAFGKAVWEIYLGKNNLGDSIKKGLTSRL